MPWVKLDDSYFRNPKIRAVGPRGVALHLAAACWVADHLTDGFIPLANMRDVLHDAQVTRKLVASCVEVGLLDEIKLDGKLVGWMVHDWQHYIRSRAQVQKERTRWAKLKAGQRHPQEADGECPPVDSSVDSPAESSVVSRGPVPVPVVVTSVNNSHPLPTVNGKAGEVLEALLKAERNGSSPARNPRAWNEAVTVRLIEQHGPRITQLVHDFPDAPPATIAGHIRGELTNLAHYRSETA